MSPYRRLQFFCRLRLMFGKNENPGHRSGVALYVVISCSIHAPLQKEVQYSAMYGNPFKSPCVGSNLWACFKFQTFPDGIPSDPRINARQSPSRKSTVQSRCSHIVYNNAVSAALRGVHTMPIGQGSDSRRSRDVVRTVGRLRKLSGRFEWWFPYHWALSLIVWTFGNWSSTCSQIRR